MLVTEREAKPRRCPYNQSGAGWVGNCVASNCMAWRWTDDAIEGNATVIYDPKAQYQERLGYCGACGTGAKR